MVRTGPKSVLTLSGVSMPCMGRRLNSPEWGCIAAMAAVFGMTAKLSLVDGIVFPKSTYIAAGICTTLCVGDFFMGGGKAKKA